MLLVLAAAERARWAPVARLHWLAALERIRSLPGLQQHLLVSVGTMLAVAVVLVKADTPVQELVVLVAAEPEVLVPLVLRPQQIRVAAAEAALILGQRLLEATVEAGL